MLSSAGVPSGYLIFMDIGECDKDKVLLYKVINLPTVKTNMYTDIDIFKTSFFFLVVFEMKKEWK